MQIDQYHITNRAQADGICSMLVSQLIIGNTRTIACLYADPELGVLLTAPISVDKLYSMHLNAAIQSPYFGYFDTSLEHYYKVWVTGFYQDKDGELVTYYKLVDQIPLTSDFSELASDMVYRVYSQHFMCHTLVQAATGLLKADNEDE